MNFGENNSVYEKNLSIDEELIKYFDRKLGNLCRIYVQLYFLCLKLR